MSKLYCVSLTLKSSGAIWKITEHDCEVCEKIIKYVVEKNGGIRIKTIHKISIMKLRNRIIPSTSLITDTVFCFEEQLDEAKKMVQDKVFNCAIKFYNEILDLYYHVESVYTANSIEKIKLILKQS